MPELILGITKPFSVGRPESIVFVVPKEVRKRVRVKKGTLWHVKVDERDRIIYERLKEFKESKSKGEGEDQPEDSDYAPKVEDGMHACKWFVHAALHPQLAPPARTTTQTTRGGVSSGQR